MLVLHKSKIGIFDIFLALVPMGPILVSIDATFSRNQYQGEYPYGARGTPNSDSRACRTFCSDLIIETFEFCRNRL